MSIPVAVSAPRRTDGGRERVALNAAYVRALAGAGLLPLIVAPILDPQDAAAALAGVRGLVLTGGEDVEPARYGATAHAKLGAIDPARDAVELALAERAWTRGLPILAICRGIQLLNVARGGTLYQDLATERPGPYDHAAGGARHCVRIAAGSRVHEATRAATLDVNSRHHQAVRDLAPGLVATAWADDGVIEAIEPAPGTGPWTLAVQWHPEDDAGDALFRSFAAAARDG